MYKTYILRDLRYSKDVLVIGMGFVEGEVQRIDEKMVRKQLRIFPGHCLWRREGHKSLTKGRSIFLERQGKYFSSQKHAHFHYAIPFLCQSLIERL